MKAICGPVQQGASCCMQAKGDSGVPGSELCSGREGTIKSAFGSWERGDRNNREGAETRGKGQRQVDRMKQELMSRRGREVTKGERREQEPEKDGMHKRPGRETPFPREQFSYTGFDMETLRISPLNTG